MSADWYFRKDCRSKASVTGMKMSVGSHPAYGDWIQHKCHSEYLPLAQSEHEGLICPLGWTLGPYSELRLMSHTWLCPYSFFKFSTTSTMLLCVFLPLLFHHSSLVFVPRFTVSYIQANRVQGMNTKRLWQVWYFVWIHISWWCEPPEQSLPRWWSLAPSFLLGGAHNHLPNSLQAILPGNALHALFLCLFITSHVG